MNSRLISSLTRWTELGDHASPLKMRTVVPLIFKVTNSRIRNCGERFPVTSPSPLMQNLWPCAWCVFRPRVRSAESFGSTICTWLRRCLRIDFRGQLASPNLARQEQSPVPAPAVINSGVTLLDSVLFYGTFSLLMFAPLAFGSVDPWSIFVLQAGAATLLLLWTIRQAKSGSLTIVANPLFRPVLLFGLLILVQISLGVTAYRYQTVANCLLYAAYACLFFLAIQHLQRTIQVKVLAWLFCVYGTVVAMFAVFQSLSSSGKIYWLWEPPSGGWIYGPYVNHNHYAGLMEMLFPIALVMALTRHIPRRWRPVPLLGATLMAASIFLCGSR